MKKHSILTLISAALLGFGAASCDDYLDVNKNVDAPDYVDAYLYLPGVQQAFYNVYGDALHAGSLAQMLGTGSSYYGHYYPLNSDTGGGMWRMTYWEQGMNLENLINQSIAEEDWHMAGIGLILKALSWDYSTKYNGEMPLDDAYVPGLLSHDYDYQEYIYMKIREWAKQGIAYLEMEDKSSLRGQIAPNDYIYGGNIEKWKKFGYAVIVRNLASLTQKNDFASKYYPQLIEAAGKAFTSVDDDATVTVDGGGAEAQSSSLNNYWGVYRGNLSSNFHQYQWAVDVFQGMIREVDVDANEYAQVDSIYQADDTLGLYPRNTYKYKLMDKQIISDTAVFTPGHWDPRRVAKLETVDGNHVANFAEIDSIKSFIYHGGTYGNVAYFMSSSDYYGASTARNGQGRWLYRNDAPYILTTYAELMFNVAEAHWTVGKKAEAFEAWKTAVAADMEFTAKYLVAGSVNVVNETLASGKKGDVTFHIGDKITAAQFNTAAAEYLAGPFVGGLSMDEFSLSHIMMQKFVALYPWGAHEAWVDQRKYHYDINYDKNMGDGVPGSANGWDINHVDQKLDTDPTKVYKGYYIYAASLRGNKFNEKNNGSPCYRIRPRYNSEYMWNKPSLATLKPIAGTADNYQCSMPWFCYPGDQPGAPTYDEVAE